MGGQGLGEVLEDADPGRLGPPHPVGEEGLRRGLVRLFPELPEILLQIVRGGQRLVQAQGLLEALVLAACVVEVLGTLEQQPARALENSLVLKIGDLALDRAPQVRELAVEELGDVETVEDVGSRYSDRLFSRNSDRVLTGFLETVPSGSRAAMGQLPPRDQEDDQYA